MNTIPDDTAVLRRELIGLFGHIQRIRHEIASIRKPGADEDKFNRMADELDAIVAATEEATNSIMENVEQIESLVAQARPFVTDPEAQAALDQVEERIGSIFEACTFQDITGQRVTKVVKLIKFVEDRVNALINIWGQHALADVEVKEKDRGEYDKYLNGPQLRGGVSQDEVDALMGGGLRPAVATGARKAAPAPVAPVAPARATPATPSVAPPTRAVAPKAPAKAPAPVAPPTRAAVPAAPARVPAAAPVPPVAPSRVPPQAAPAKVVPPKGPAAPPPVVAAAPKAVPAPPPKKAPEPEPAAEDSAPTFSQDDIDKLFG